MIRNGTIRSRPTGWIVWIIAGCMIAFVSGCGSSGPERVVVSGKVTFRGEPVKTGEIRFIPAKDTEGSVEGARIVDGEYRADGKGGVPLGTYTVNIVAWNGWAPRRDMPSPDASAGRQNGESARVQLLPAKYNSQSELKITVTSGSRGVSQDFTLID